MQKIEALRTVGGSFVCIEIEDSGRLPILVPISESLIIGVNTARSEDERPTIHVFIKDEEGLYCPVGSMDVTEDTANFSVTLNDREDSPEFVFGL